MVSSPGNAAMGPFEFSSARPRINEMKLGVEGSCLKILARGVSPVSTVESKARKF
jgi:hypothetical protein